MGELRCVLRNFISIPMVCCTLTGYEQESLQEEEEYTTTFSSVDPSINTKLLER